MRRVTGIGGVFFKSNDPVRVVEWYRTHLGIASGDWGGFAFQWSDKERPHETGYTIWSVFPDSTAYFAPGEQSFMVNFRVADLVGLIATLKEEGVEVLGEIEQHPEWKVRMDPRPGWPEGRTMGACRLRGRSLSTVRALHDFLPAHRLSALCECCERGSGLQRHCLQRSGSEPGRPLIHDAELLLESQSDTADGAFIEQTADERDAVRDPARW